MKNQRTNRPPIALNLFLLLSCLLMLPDLQAQTKFDYQNRIDLTFEQRLQLGNQYFNQTNRERGNGYKQFERWKYWSRRSLDENGRIITQEQIDREVAQFNGQLAKGAIQSAISGNLTEMGPMAATNTSTWSSHLGRLTWISVEPGNFNHILVSAPTGGVWKTTNNGGTWTPLFDGMTNMNVYATEISHANSQHYFVGTNGSGIWRSTNGGTTWTQSTGITNGDLINMIKMHPTDANTLYATGQFFNGNLYRSTDGGASWVVVFNDGIAGLYDIEFKPTDANTIYIGAVAGIYVSTNAGVNFNFIGDGAPFAGAGVIMMAVTPANGNYVYALAENGGGFHAVYLSTDSGTTWNTQSDNSGGNNNILTYVQTNAGGQAPRDQDIEVSPTDVTEVHVAGVETWKSTNSGVTWTQSTDWNLGELTLPFIHADIDQLTYVSVGATHRLYAATDGGIFYSDNGAANWTDITQGIGTRQFYRIGVSKTEVDRVVGGSQDNGGGIIRGGVWYDWLGADGMETFVDKSVANTIYGTTQNGSLYKSINGGNTIIGINRPAGEGDGAWITPFEEDPAAANTIYSAYRQVYKSTDGGGSWNPISNFTKTGMGADTTLMELKIAPSDNQTIYAAFSGRMYRTTNGGTNWTLLTFPVAFTQINYITVHPTNANRLMITISGGTARVLESINAGTNWTDISSNLPALATQCALYEADATDGIYVGMNPGLYYKNNASGGNWTNAGNNLPNVSVTELEIQHNTLYVGTYGRGLWKASLGAGATYTWTGAVNSDWMTAGNWSSTMVPTGANDVIIPNVTNDPVISNGQMASSNSVVVQANGSLTVQSGGTLNTTTNNFSVDPAGLFDAQNGSTVNIPQ